ncbi:hypothetical protein AJ80_09841 [Polytolypa hystricis UAMH7299]|uniref:J domain-containing protein n=1 Tax=Polytolypa hystricis (strain UAMH7299) TaxID=1447883 RepID=A0A2B7W9V7_POLH7|nr:hypothetical protein AJ80_09841 [Polytolypa hystricis UAMH7299]
MAGSIEYPVLPPSSPPLTEAGNNKRNHKRPRPTPDNKPKQVEDKTALAHNDLEPGTVQIISKPRYSTMSDATDEDEIPKRKTKTPSSVISKLKGKGKEKEKAEKEEKEKDEEDEENEKEKLKQQKKEALDAVLAAKSDDPYEILGIPDPCEYEVRAQALNRLVLLIHPDKNPDPRATEAIRRLIWAGKKLKVRGETFNPNAFFEDEERPGDVDVDEGGDVVMAGETDGRQRPIPSAFVQELYTRATQHLVMAVKFPSELRPKKELDAINSQIVAESQRERGKDIHLEETPYIRYNIFTSTSMAASDVLKWLRSIPSEQFKFMYEQSTEMLNKLNDTISYCVEENHYPQGWKAKFSLTKDGQHYRVSWPNAEDGRKSFVTTRHGGEASPSGTRQSKDQQERTRSDGASSPRKTWVWKPGETRQGERILACKELICRRREGRKLNTPEVTGHLFIVQANGPDSRICEIRSGSEIGWKATHAYLALPDKKMWGGGKSTIPYGFEEVDEILEIAYSEDKPGLGLLVSTKVPGNGDDRLWITRTALRESWGAGDANRTIDRILEEGGKRPLWNIPRLEYKQLSDESDSEFELGRNRSSRRLAAKASNKISVGSDSDTDSDSEAEVCHDTFAGRRASKTSTRWARGRALKNGVALDEDPEIGELRRLVARLGRERRVAGSRRREKRFRYPEQMGW